MTNTPGTAPVEVKFDAVRVILIICLLDVKNKNITISKNMNDTR